MTAGFPGLGTSPNNREIAERINRLNQGKFNAVTTLTLTANAASTTLTDKRIGGSTWIGLMPMTANAAAALATTFIDSSARANGSAVITHANNAQVDKTYAVLLIG